MRTVFLILMGAWSFGTAIAAGMAISSLAPFQTSQRRKLREALDLHGVQH